MTLNRIKIKIAKSLNIPESELIYPVNNTWGDLSWPLFKVSLDEKNSLSQVAERIKKDLLGNQELMSMIKEIEIAGPYLNFFIKAEFLLPSVLGDIFRKKKDYGFNNEGEGELSIFEFSNLNTHKDFHIGHLRNISLGSFIYKINQANGYRAYPVSYINDFGIHTAKAIWSYKRAYSEDIGKCYINTVKEIEANPDIIKEVGKIMADIEKRRGLNYKIWKKTRQKSLKEFNKIYKLLKVNFKKTYFENKIIERGFKIVDDLFEKGILKKSEGAIIADLEKYNLGVLPIIRSDGTALYPVADLALAEKKTEDFRKLEKSFIIVDVRQALYFKQLFKVFKLAEYKNDFIHLSYDFITLPGGLMSSRSGSAIPFSSLYQETFSKLLEESKRRHPDWREEKIKKNCQKLTVAILKFEMLKVSPRKIITFDLKEATKLDGFSALYILYSLVRIKSILKKAKFKKNSSWKRFDFSLLNSSYEKELSLKLAKYPDIIKKSGLDFDPSELAKYLFELSKLFNDYYQNIKILSSEPQIKKARLVFISSIIIVMENALNILGLESLEEI